MLSLHKRVQKERKEFGISQVELSRLAEVSLATVQNLEAGRGNPCLTVLSRIAEALGLELSLSQARVDWDALVDHGLPLSKLGSRRTRPTAMGLLHHLRRAAQEVETNFEGSVDERKQVSLEALLLAVKTGYASYYKKWLQRSPLLARITPSQPSGRVIKLKRIAQAKLGEYL